MQFPTNVPSEKTHEQYNFSMKFLTQTMNKKLFIEQSSEGLKISVQSNDRKITTIPKYMIVGLPKLDLIPKEFFDLCSARLVSLEFGSKVYFDLALKGGGIGSSSEPPIEEKIGLLRSSIDQLNQAYLDYMSPIEIGVKEIEWGNIWLGLNNELSQILAPSSSIATKKEGVFNNIEKRIEFYRKKRQFLTTYQLELAHRHIGLIQLVPFMKQKIAEIERYQDDVEDLTDGMHKGSTWSAFFFRERYLDSILPYADYGWDSWSCHANSKLLEVQLAMPRMKEETCKQIAECDRETFRLEKLFLAMKINQMHLDQMMQIDAPSIQKALGNGEIINFPGQNGNNSYLD